MLVGFVDVLLGGVVVGQGLLFEKDGVIGFYAGWVGLKDLEYFGFVSLTLDSMSLTKPIAWVIV